MLWGKRFLFLKYYFFFLPVPRFLIITLISRNEREKQNRILPFSFGFRIPPLDTTSNGKILMRHSVHKYTSGIYLRTRIYILVVSRFQTSECVVSAAFEYSLHIFCLRPNHPSHSNFCHPNVVATNTQLI